MLGPPAVPAVAPDLGAPTITMNRCESLDGSALETRLFGYELLNDPLLNKGTAFTDTERDDFVLHGLLPPNVATLDERRPEATAVAIGDGRFIAVGDERDMQAFRSSHTRTIDAGGSDHSTRRRSEPHDAGPTAGGRARMSKEAQPLFDAVTRAQRVLPAGRWAPFLRNHDQTRTLSELDGDGARRATADERGRRRIERRARRRDRVDGEREHRLPDGHVDARPHRLGERDDALLQLELARGHLHAVAVAAHVELDRRAASVGVDVEPGVIGLDRRIVELDSARGAPQPV